MIHNGLEDSFFFGCFFLTFQVFWLLFFGRVSACVFWLAGQKTLGFNSQLTEFPLSSSFQYENLESEGDCKFIE